MSIMIQIVKQPMIKCMVSIFHNLQIQQYKNKLSEVNLTLAKANAMKNENTQLKEQMIEKDKEVMN